MPTLFARWTTVKAELDKCKALYPKDAWAKLDQTSPLVSALKAFDKADGYEGWHKAVLTVRTAKTGYDTQLRAVMKTIEAAGKNGSPAYKALDKMEKSLVSI